MNKFAQKGQVYVCSACGKRSKDTYGKQAIDRGWDVSCMLAATLCDEATLVMEDGRVVKADAIKKLRDKTEIGMKIETKHGYWQVIIEQGEYSDHCECFIVIAANSPEETWDRVKWLYDTNALPVLMSENGYIVSQEFGKYGKIDEDWYQRDITITIAPLDVYYFNGKEEKA